MAFNDDDLEKKLIQLGMVSDTLASAWGKGAKSATARAIAEENLSEDIKKRLGKNKEEADQLAKKIISDERSLRKQEENDAKRLAAANKLITDFKGLAVGSINASQAIYSSDKAFSSVTPTLELVGTAAKAVASAFTGIVTGIPIISGLSEASNKLLGEGIDISTQVATMMLNNAQQYVDTYTNLSKIGLNFGGNLERMTEAAAEGGMSLMNYQKFVTSSIESLKNMGGTVDQAAGRITKMSQAALKNNDRLLVEYGGYDQVADALANFTGMLSKAGVDTVRIQSQLTETSGKYLESLKIMEAVTGKTAKQQQSEQEKALQNAAFAREIARVTATEGPAAAAAIMQGLSEVSATMGEAGADVYKEYAATGHIMSETNQLYLSQLSTQGKVIMGMADNAKQYKGDTKGRVNANAELLSSNKASMDAQAKFQDAIVNLAFLLTDGPGAKINQFMAEWYNTNEKRENYTKAKDKAIADAKDKEGAALKGVAGAYDAQNKTQQAMDKRTQDSIGNMGSLVVTLNNLNVKLLDTFGPSLTTAVDLFAKGISKIAKQLGIQAPRGLSSTVEAELAGTPDQMISSELGGQVLETGKAARAATGKITANAMEKTQKTGGAWLDQDHSQATLSAPIEQGGFALKMAPDHPDIQRDNANLDPNTIRAAAIIQELLGDHFAGITGMNDNHHKDLNSLHNKGLAFDFVTSPAPESEEDSADIMSKMQAQLNLMGIKNAEIKDEYFHPSAGATGKHFHVGLKALRKGGMIGDGELAVVGDGGPEVVQGPGKVTSVAETESLSATLIALNDKFDTLINTMSKYGELEKDLLTDLVDVVNDHKDISEKHLWASA